jgi:peptidoglycan/xylan/chitin deacetylase (PgdA/CDA1 family)
MPIKVVFDSEKKTVAACDLVPGRVYVADEVDPDERYIAIAIHTNMFHVLPSQHVPDHDDPLYIRLAKDVVNPRNSVVAITTDGYYVSRNTDTRFIEIEAQLTY